jgi:uncharacterized protein (TIGR03086 family)
MQETSIFELADHALNAVVAQIRDDQWDVELPASFATSAADHVPTLRELIGYHAYDDSWVPDMLAGRTMAEVGEDAFRGDLLGDDPKGNFARVVDTAVAAAQAFDDPERTVHCSFGDFTAQHYLWQANFFRGLRAHDLALVIGVEPGLSEELIQGLWDELSPVADEWRTYGVFPPAVPVPDEAPLLDRLLGLTGRNPSS